MARLNLYIHTLIGCIATPQQPQQFVAQLGGISTWVFNTFIENNMAVTNNGMGTFFFVGGGVMVRGVGVGGWVGGGGRRLGDGVDVMYVVTENFGSPS